MLELVSHDGRILTRFPAFMAEIEIELPADGYLDGYL